MTDREMLEFAAKAAGEWPSPEPFEHVLDRWNPLTDDGDALRLAVKRGMEVNIDWAKLCVRVWDGTGEYYYEQLSTDSINCDIEPYAATRRAIVRAAAEIGRNMT